MLKKEGNMARRWFLIDEKVRFVIAGIVNMAIRYLIFVLLGLFFSVSRYQLILLTTWLLSSVIAFFSYKYLVFRTEGNHLKEFVKSLLIWCLSYVLNAALLEVLAGRLAWNVYLAQAAAIVLVVAVNYLCSNILPSANKRRVCLNIFIISGNKEFSVCHVRLKKR